MREPPPPPIPAGRVRAIAREHIKPRSPPRVSAELELLASWMDEVVPPDDETGREQSRPRLRMVRDEPEGG